MNAKLASAVFFLSLAFTNCSPQGAFESASIQGIWQSATDHAAERPFLAVATDGTSEAAESLEAATLGAPIITEQPTTQYGRENSWAELRVSVKNPAGVHVQWFKNSVAVPGATSGTYRFKITSQTIGFYAALVYYDSSRITTSAGVYTAMAPAAIAPSITLHPVSQTLATGSSLKLVAGYTGDPFPQVQWYKNGIAIPGANSATLSVTSTGSYSYYIWNEAGSANSVAATVSAPSQNPTTITDHGLGGIAFTYSNPQSGTHNLRVGHAKISGGTISGRYFEATQANVNVVQSGIQGYNSSGGRCGGIRKPVLSEVFFTGTVSVDVNTITLRFNGHTVVYARTLGSKKVSLLSVNGSSNPVGFGYATKTDPAITKAIASDFGGAAFIGNVGQYYHKRGSENWWLLGYEMGAVAQSSRDSVSSGLVTQGQYDSFLFSQQSGSPNVVFRHFGTDFTRSNCNNSDGHVHLMYGFGESGNLLGFVGVETSTSLDGNYLSVFSYLKTGMNH